MAKDAKIKIVNHNERPMRFSNGKPGYDADNMEIGIIEHGTTQGQTVVAIKLETMEGVNIFAEMTGRQFAMLVDCYNAANIRFADRARHN